MSVKSYFFLLPVLNILFDILFVFENLGPALATIRAILIGILVIYIVFHTPKALIVPHPFIFLLIFYVSFLAVFSSDYNSTLPQLLKFALTLLMFPVSYLLVQSLNDFKRLNNILLIVLALFIVNFIITITFGLGREVYTKSDEFMSGNIIASALYTGSLGLLIMPAIYLQFHKKKHRLIIILIGICVFIILILSFRRTAVFSVIIGYTTFFIFYRKRQKLIKWLILIALVIFSTFPLYKNIFITRYEAREKELDPEMIESEGRFVETQLVWRKALSFKPVHQSLFGHDLFNTAGKYGYPDYRRVLHGDINIIVFGTGLVGLFLYLIVYIKILRLKTIRRISAKDGAFYLMLKALFISLIVTSIAISFSSGLLAMTYRTLLFTYLGAIAKLLDLKALQNRKITLNNLSQSYVG